MVMDGLYTEQVFSHEGQLVWLCLKDLSKQLLNQITFAYSHLSVLRTHSTGMRSELA